MKIFYFTATGNCLAVAKKIGGELVSIPTVLHEDVADYKDDAIGFVFPVYDGTYPRIMRELLENKRFEAEYFFAVAVYGFFSGAAAPHFEKLARAHGIALNYSAEIKMVDNYLPLFDIEKEIKKIPGKKIDETLERIVADVTARKHQLVKNNSFVRAIGTFTERPMLKKTNSGLAARDFSVNESCIQCGTCAKVCPAGNIRVDDKVVFGDKCYSCFACLHVCPKNALHINGERSSKRWRNPDVKLKELIDSNSQL